MRIFLVLAMAVITIGYALDNSAGSGSQEQGLVIKNWKGEYIGTSKHAVQDSSTGKIIIIIVSLGKDENKEVAVPAVFFSVGNKDEDLVLNLSRKELESAPEYHASDLQDPEFARKVYRFFAAVIPRTEETSEERKGI